MFVNNNFAEATLHLKPNPVKSIRTFSISKYKAENAFSLEHHFVSLYPLIFNVELNFSDLLGEFKLNIFWTIPK